MKTGQCKFGATCKFHHPQPTGYQIPAPSPVPPVSPLPVPVPSPLYPTVQPPSSPSSQQYGVLVARPPLLPGSLVHGPYGPVLLSHGMVPYSGWGPYQVGSAFLVDCLLTLYAHSLKLLSTWCRLLWQALYFLLVLHQMLVQHSFMG